MFLRKLLRYLLLTFTGIIGFLFLLIATAVAPVDRTPVQSLRVYDTMMERLNSLSLDFPAARSGFSVGFGKVNITPAEPTATAGYGKRMGKPYVTVHDSVYIRALVVDNGSARVAVVSADLLIMPPTVTKLLQERLRSIGFSLDNTYLGATHSHNSIGHWGEGAATLIYGHYEEAVVAFIADAIVRSITEATHDLMPAVLKSGAIAIPQAVENRLIGGGEEDPFFRAIEVQRSDSSRLLLMSYTAHATCLSQRTLALSRDYPGVLVDSLESGGYAFAMFMAGAVGSHKGSAPADDWECTAWMGNELSTDFLDRRDTLSAMTDTTLGMRRMPLLLGDPQVKIADEWKLRSWLFRAAFGEYDAFLTVLRIGDVVMLGAPCDFSGEFDAAIDSLAGRHGVKTMVTSFNGGYIGYLTPAKHYDVDHYETRLMNWYAPGTGDYVSECLKKLMVAASDTR